MLLSPEDAELFFKLHRSLMCYANQRLAIIPDISTPDEFSSLPPKARLDVRNAFLDEIDLIDLFVDDNPSNFTDEELDIVQSWHDQVVGKFFIFRQLKKHMVFLGTADPPVAYGVLALTEPFEDLVGPYLPVWTETVLLPFNGRIVYDGLLSRYNISFGGSIQRGLNDSYRQAKAQLGIVTSLPVMKAAAEAAVPQKPKKIRQPRNPFKGRWRITWMEQWKQDFVDAEVDGYFEFDAQGSGSFQFGYVRGEIDHRPSKRDGQPCLEFTFQGNDELDPVTGRGWVQLDGKQLQGMIVFHQGDESAFTATRLARTKKRKLRGAK